MSSRRRRGALLRTVAPAMLPQPLLVSRRPVERGRFRGEYFLDHEVAVLQHVDFDRKDERVQHAANVGRTPTQTPQHTGTGVNGVSAHAVRCAPLARALPEPL